LQCTLGRFGGGRRDYHTTVEEVGERGGGRRKDGNWRGGRIGIGEEGRWEEGGWEVGEEGREGKREEEMGERVETKEEMGESVETKEERIEIERDHDKGNECTVNCTFEFVSCVLCTVWLGSVVKTINFHATGSKRRLDRPFLWRSVKLLTINQCYATPPPSPQHNMQCSNKSTIDCTK